MPTAVSREFWSKVVELDSELHRNAPRSTLNLLGRTSTDSWLHRSGQLVQTSHLLGIDQALDDFLAGDDAVPEELAGITLVTWEGFRRRGIMSVCRGMLTIIDVRREDMVLDEEAGTYIMPATQTHYAYFRWGNSLMAPSPRVMRHSYRLPDLRTDDLAPPPADKDHIVAQFKQIVPPPGQAYLLEELGRGALGAYRTPDLGRGSA